MPKDFGEFGEIPKDLAKDQTEVLEKLSKITKEQWRAMRPIFDTMYELAQSGGLGSFIQESFDKVWDTISNVVLLPFMPLIEEALPLIMDVLGSALPTFIDSMEGIAEIIRDALGIKIGGMTVGEIFGVVLGWIAKLILDPVGVGHDIWAAIAKAVVEPIKKLLYDLFHGDTSSLEPFLGQFPWFKSPTPERSERPPNRPIDWNFK